MNTPTRPARCLSLALALVSLGIGSVAAAETREGSEVAALFSLPKLERPVRVAIYEGAGSQESGIRDVEKGVKLLAGATIERLSAKQFSESDLAEFDVVVFSAGGATAQARAIGDAGRAKVREFVKRGGGYLGICAGAYLACAEFDWGLELIAAETLSDRWERGVATVDMQLTAEGLEAFGRVKAPMRVAYENGPVIGPIKREDMPAYKSLARFTTEVAENGSPAGIMTGSPAMAESRFGVGRVMIFSPHPERTAGLEQVVPLAVARLVGEGKITQGSRPGLP